MRSFIKKPPRLNPATLTLLAVLVTGAAYIFDFPFLQLMELKTIDLRFGYRGSIPKSEQVVIAAIDEKSLSREGKWVWPRATFARLIDRLSDAGARAVVFDVGFLEPDRRDVTTAVKKIRNQARRMLPESKPFEEYLLQIEKDSDNDRLLAEAIARSKAKVVLGYFFQMSKTESLHLAEHQIDHNERNIKTSAFQIAHFESSDRAQAPIPQAGAPQANIDALAQVAGHAGFFNMVPDRDGVVRWIPTTIQFRDNLYAPLSLMSLSAYHDTQLSIKVANFGVVHAQVGDIEIPVDSHGRMFINYRGPAKTFPHYSITDLLAETVPSERLKDKIVLIGATSVGIYDMRVTPFGSTFPGVEIHANTIDTILNQDFIERPSWAALFDLLAIIILAILLGAILSRGGAMIGAAASLTLVISHIGLCHYLFVAHGWVLNMVHPLTVMLLTYISITAFKYLKEARQKRFIREAFSTYVAPEVVKDLMDAPEKLVLGGEDREITAFFSDIVSFTSISEKLTPAQLVELLNELLTEMTDIIMAHEGTVDKFIGDAIVAIFGAPNKLENHAHSACLVGLDMQQRLKELRFKWRTQGLPELEMRIGLCSGSAVIGNMGSKNKMNYTMMGDTVNTASRLEGVNKIYGTELIISERTYREAIEKEPLIVRELDRIVAVGKAVPVTIYELVGRESHVPRPTLRTIQFYARALAAYRQRQWQEAMQLLEDALKIMPADGPCQTLLNRCRKYSTQPPPKDWNTAHVLTSK